MRFTWMKSFFFFISILNAVHRIYPIYLFSADILTIVLAMHSQQCIQKRQICNLCAFFWLLLQQLWLSFLLSNVRSEPMHYFYLNSLQLEWIKEEKKNKSSFWWYWRLAGDRQLNDTKSKFIPRAQNWDWVYLCSHEWISYFGSTIFGNKAIMKWYWCVEIIIVNCISI